MIKVKEEEATVNIIQVNENPITSYIEGILKKQNIRKSEIDKIKMEDSFLPGDMIKAKIVNFPLKKLTIGDGFRINLTTTTEDTGVIFGKSLEKGSLLVPITWTEMIDPDSLSKEKR